MAELLVLIDHADGAPQEGPNQILTAANRSPADR